MHSPALAPLTRRVLLALALAGLLLTWLYNLRYLAGGGSLMPGPFFQAAFANDLTTAITLDVYLAALAFSLGVAADQGAGRARWWAVAATFGIGLAVSLPGYLWWRSRSTGRDASTP